MVELICSGGQTGADQGGLLAAEILGIKTGGVVPKGFLTETGPKPELGTRFGLTESKSKDYTVRTRENVVLGDGTVIFGYLSGGSKLTQKICEHFSRPYFFITSLPDSTSGMAALIMKFRVWIKSEEIKALNVAGNRESKNKGIEAKVTKFLVGALHD